MPVEGDGPPRQQKGRGNECGSKSAGVCGRTGARSDAGGLRRIGRERLAAAGQDLLIGHGACLLALAVLDKNVPDPEQVDCRTDSVGIAVARGDGECNDAGIRERNWIVVGIDGGGEKKGRRQAALLERGDRLAKQVEHEGLAVVWIAEGERIDGGNAADDP